MRRITGVLLAALCLGLAVRTPAFVSYVTNTGQPEKWNLLTYDARIFTNNVNPFTHAVRYFLAADAYSSANRVAELDACRACFAQWQSVPNSVLRFEEGGLASGNLDVNTTDHTNLVFWAKDTTVVNNGFDNIAGATGVTYSRFYSDGILAESDIVLNGTSGFYGFTWFTDFFNTINQAEFVETVLLHEIGHFIGLAHSPVGASTMFTRGSGGVGVQAGLSADEIAAVHALYPSSSLPPLGRLTGTLTYTNGLPVFGGIITIEEKSSGNVAAGTMSRQGGAYDLPALPAGDYLLRASPTDPVNASYFLFRGSDVEPGFKTNDVSFLATTNTPVTVSAGVNKIVNLRVVPGKPSLQIGRLARPAPSGQIALVNYASAIPYGQSNVVVGVYSSDLPGPDATLSVTGNGLTIGQTTIQTNAFPGLNPPLNLISAPLHVDPSATPGMRTLVVQQSTGLTYANGYLEISPRFPDYNFDGLDDRFQRTYFPLWTAPEAVPTADPDGDHFSNTSEYFAGTDPTDASSEPKVESVRLDASGATVAWPSAAGKRYQLLSRSPLNGIRGWQAAGAPVVATGNRTTAVDTNMVSELRFYRVQSLPLE